MKEPGPFDLGMAPDIGALDFGSAMGDNLGANMATVWNSGRGPYTGMDSGMHSGMVAEIGVTQKLTMGCHMGWKPGGENSSSACSYACTGINTWIGIGINLHDPIGVVQAL